MRFARLILALVCVLVAGCNASNSAPPDSQATTQSAYRPADGRNLSPELQKDFGHDPLWPNDLGISRH